MKAKVFWSVILAEIVVFLFFAFECHPNHRDASPSFYSFSLSGSEVIRFHYCQPAKKAIILASMHTKLPDEGRRGQEPYVMSYSLLACDGTVLCKGTDVVSATGGEDGNRQVNGFTGANWTRCSNFESSCNSALREDSFAIIEISVNQPRTAASSLRLLFADGESDIDNLMDRNVFVFQSANTKEQPAE